MRHSLEKIVMGNLIVIFIAVLVFSCNKLYRSLVDVVETKQFYVQSKNWKSTQLECEDYQEYVCKPIEECKRDSDGNRVCKDIVSCNWETKTRIHNTWTRDGYYPEKPKYTEHYTLPLDHYEKRWMEFWISFKSGDAGFSTYTRDENYYNSFRIEEVYKVDYNYWGSAINIYR